MTMFLAPTLVTLALPLGTLSPGALRKANLA
jgi:hypothetical protein